MEISEKDIVDDVLNSYPDTLEIFLRYGFKDLTNPMMRRTMAKFATIEKVCRMKKVDQAEFLAELNAAVTPS